MDEKKQKYKLNLQSQDIHRDVDGRLRDPLSFQKLRVGGIEKWNIKERGSDYSFIVRASMAGQGWGVIL